MFNLNNKNWMRWRISYRKPEINWSWRSKRTH